MKQNKVLLTGYKGEINDLSTTEVLLNKINNKFDKFLFTNNFDAIKEEINEILKKNDYHYIIMFGWKPMTNRLNVELECFYNNEYLYTNFPFDKILNPLKENNIDYKVGETPGTSYCNFAYYHVLKYIKNHNLKTKAIFIHIPHLDNFVQFDKVVDLLNKIELI